MSIAHWLVVLSFVISIGGVSVYIRDTFKGTTKPNRVSWLMWSISPFISTGAAISAGADLWPTSRIFLSGFFTFIVFLVSFRNKKSYWKLTGFDMACGACSVLALMFWTFVDSPRTAILLAATGDAWATIPTIRKSWTNPNTETGLTYITSLVSVLLIVPSIPVWNIENAAYQSYLIIANSFLVLSVYHKQWRAKR